MDIILASTSPYRQQLLERLRLDFRCVSPDVDESPRPGESPATLSARLGLAKARSVAASHPGAVVIGSDQVAALEGRIVGKPGNFNLAVSQLERASGREMRFFTSIAVVCIQQNLERFHVEPFAVRFRSLTSQQIDTYLRLDRPYDCAGGFKVESLGIALFEELTGNDPTSLQGLPLIKLTELLVLAGINVLDPQAHFL